jgi:5-methylcytosine-specific restriction endonuclease McrA
MTDAVPHPRAERPYCDLVYAHDQGGTPRYRVAIHPEDRPGFEKKCGHPRGAVGALRLAARKFEGTRCAYGVRCSDARLMQVTIDHVVARDGSQHQHALSNLLVACDACNSHKGRTPLAEWLQEHGRSAS